jgi:hypothetical protein
MRGDGRNMRVYHYFSKIISNLAKIQYINILNNIYEILPITFIITVLKDTIAKPDNNF